MEDFQFVESVFKNKKIHFLFISKYLSKSSLQSFFYNSGYWESLFIPFLKLCRFAPKQGLQNFEKRVSFFQNKKDFYYLEKNNEWQKKVSFLSFVQNKKRNNLFFSNFKLTFFKKKNLSLRSQATARDTNGNQKVKKTSLANQNLKKHPKIVTENVLIQKRNPSFSTMPQLANECEQVWSEATKFSDFTKETKPSFSNTKKNRNFFSCGKTCHSVPSCGANFWLPELRKTLPDCKGISKGTSQNLAAKLSNFGYIGKDYELNLLQGGEKTCHAVPSCGEDLPFLLGTKIGWVFAILNPKIYLHKHNSVELAGNSNLSDISFDNYVTLTRFLTIRFVNTFFELKGTVDFWLKTVNSFHFGLIKHSFFSFPEREVRFQKILFCFQLSPLIT